MTKAMANVRFPCGNILVSLLASVIGSLSENHYPMKLSETIMENFTDMMVAIAAMCQAWPVMLMVGQGIISIFRLENPIIVEIPAFIVGLRMTMLNRGLVLHA